MASMKWTTDKPTQSGYWWFTDGVGKVVKHVIDVRGILWALDMGDANAFRLDGLHGQWSTEPIKEPEEG